MAQGKRRKKKPHPNRQLERRPSSGWGPNGNFNWSMFVTHYESTSHFDATAQRRRRINSWLWPLLILVVGAAAILFANPR